MSAIERATIPPRVCYIWIQLMLPRGNICRWDRRPIPRLRWIAPAVLLLLSGALATPAADNPIEPFSVCEVLKDLPAHEGHVLALLGRFSFRRDGRSLNEETCGDKPAPGEPPQATSVRLTDDVKAAPKPPAVFELDAVTITRKLKQVREHTSLRTFRFGTPDYDRWAVVYGRLEVEKTSTAQNQVTLTARLVYRGDGVVLFLHDE